MKRVMNWVAVTLVVICTTVPAVPSRAAEGGEDAGEVSIPERLVEVKRGTLGEAQQHLYEDVARLLNEARGLPKQIELRAQPADVPEEPGEEEPATAATPEPETEDWARVSEREVADPEDVAYMFFLAGEYERAAEHYARLYNDNPDNVHALQMLFLSRRNAGQAEQAAALLEQLRSHDATSEWAEWTQSMQRLAVVEEPPEQEEE